MNDTAVIDQDVVEPAEQVAEVAPEEQASDAQTSDAQSTEEVAETAKSDDRYPAKEIGQALGQRLAAAHEAGWTRPRVTALVAQVKRVEGTNGQPDTFELSSNEGEGFKMGGSALWRSRDGRIHADEVPYLTAVLDAIDAGDVQLPERPTKDAGKLKEQRDALQAKLDGVRELAQSAVDAKSAKEVREALALVLEALDA